MKTIIVPVDFSDYSGYALKAASQIAKRQNGRILAIHMLDIQSDHFNESTSYIQEKTAFLLQLAKKRFHAFLKKDYLENLEVVPIVKHFKVFSEINDLAKNENADLIVMGSHGASGLKELFVGSNTEKVIRFSEIPVMVIKNDIKDFNFDNVVYATDFSHESIDAYVRIKSIAEGFNGNMHVVYVNTPYQDFKTTPEMEKLAADFFAIADGDVENMKHTTFVLDRSVEKGILDFCNSVGADLIAMSTHARKGLSHFFKGSLSEDVANHASLPILTVKI